MQPTRYQVLFKDQHGWKAYSAFESLNPDLDGDHALQRARECSRQTEKNLGLETVIIRLSDVADAAMNGAIPDLRTL